MSLPGFASEAVENPRLGGAHFSAQPLYLLYGAHTMYNERLAESLGEKDVPTENLSLERKISAAQLINATLPYRYNLGRGGVDLELPPHLRGNLERIPRMYAHGVIISPRSLIARIAIDYSVGFERGVGMEIGDIVAH